MVQKPEPSLPMVGQHMQVGSVVWSPQHLAIAQEPRPSSAWCQETCMRTASQSGQLEILQWLRSQDPPCPLGDDICWEAARCGRLRILQWLTLQDPYVSWVERTCAAAAKGGRLEVLAVAQEPESSLSMESGMHVQWQLKPFTFKSCNGSGVMTLFVCGLRIHAIRQFKMVTRRSLSGLGVSVLPVPGMIHHEHSLFAHSKNIQAS